MIRERVVKNATSRESFWNFARIIKSQKHAVLTEPFNQSDLDIESFMYNAVTLCERMLDLDIEVYPIQRRYEISWLCVDRRTFEVEQITFYSEADFNRKSEGLINTDYFFVAKDEFAQHDSPVAFFLKYNTSNG